MQSDPEFVFSLVVIGGIVLAGLLIVSFLVFLGIAVRRKIKENNLTIYGKEKQNGQAKKGGGHGKW